MPKTILFAINDLSFGGGQMTLVEEANRLFQKGFMVYTLTLLTQKSEENFAKNLKIPAANIANIPFRSIWDFKSFFRLVKFLRSIRPDFVFSNLFFTNTIVRLTKVFNPRMKIFVREGNFPVEKSWRMKIVDFFLSLLTKKIIVNAAAIKKSFKGILPQSKIAIIYNGIDEKFFNPPGRKRKDGILTLITIARISNQKGHEYLIQALAELNKIQNPKHKIQMLIVGEGSERKKLETMIKDFNLEDEVKFLGSRGDVRKLLAEADIFVLPSLLEGMPNAMLEAMAAGVPVIATDVGGVAEVLKNGENGLLVPPKNSQALREAIMTLANDHNLRIRLAEKAKNDIRKFTWEKHINNLISLIEN